MKFSELNLDPGLQKAIDEAGFVQCFPVQEQTFRHTLAGRDVTVQSQTGSGKTAAFLITIYQQLTTNEKFRGSKALIIVPTRELATQIEDDAEKIGKYLPFRIGSFFGGIGYAKQESLLKEGVDIMIGTPGRLIDFSRQKKIDLTDVGILVIDEADRLFDMGFLPDLRKLLRKMRPAEERLTMLLSATLGLRVGALAWEYMNGAEEIQIDPEQVTVETIAQSLYHVSAAEKFSLLLGLLGRKKPRNSIIFTNTKRAAEEISKRLDINGYKSQFLMGDLPQRKRLQIIDDMKEGRISLLVATDVAARGLHVEDLDMVVNYDVPEDPENYVHRIGRTARVGKSGETVMLACERYVFGLEAIEKFIDMKIPVEPFDETLLAEDKSAGMRIRTERYGRREERDDRGRRRPGEEGRRPSRRPEAGGRRSREETPREAGKDRPVAASAPRSSGAGEGRRRPVGSGAPRNRGLDSADPRKERVINPAKKGTGRRMTPEERLAFYREKYGEDFQAHEKAGARRGKTADRDRREGVPRSAQGAGKGPEKRPPSPVKAPGGASSRERTPAGPSSRGKAPAGAGPQGKGAAAPKGKAPGGGAPMKAEEKKPSLIKSILGFFKKKS